ncbi:ankyrin repeat-containing protein ITN1 [Eucalyptus grandis]|uniref:ankyrin repeat-containing protein ITN1 n=1 Tax=Eucalyptus grandis TaxID=71139 RepID=UPI00192EE27A|nr:ankyrin repeat-containing protein ITN1 [Eucalyptus grandis]
MVDCDNRTALHNAVLGGRIRMVKALVRSNPRLTQLRDKEGRVPLGISAKEASVHKEIAWFLAKSTTDDEPSHPFRNPSAIETIIDLTTAGHHDITLYLVGRYPHLLTIQSPRYPGCSILSVLASMESHFHSGNRLSVLEALIYKCIPVNLSYKPTDKNSEPALQCFSRSLWSATKIVVPIIKRVHEVKLRNMAAVELAKQVCIAISYMNNAEITEFFENGDLLYAATVKGISEIVKLCIQFFPDLIRIRPNGSSLPAHAVRYRQARILGLFLQLSSTAELSLVLGPTDEDSQAIMFAAASYFPYHDTVTKVAGATFQMQRELKWYKAVESWVHPLWRNSYMETAGGVNMTYWNGFVKNHQELLEKGEKWVKDTANSCMLVSTLIATVLFAAAFTVPGGNDDKNGVPLLLGEDSFLVFTISDVLGLFSSVMAILLFLAILTSRYEARDFLEALPQKIIMGLCFLFLSLAFMLVAFAASLTLVLEERVEWVLIPITLLASLPVVLFVILQLPLLYQMVKSTYGPNIFCPDGIWDGVNYTKQDQ